MSSPVPTDLPEEGEHKGSETTTGRGDRGGQAGGVGGGSAGGASDSTGGDSNGGLDARDVAASDSLAIRTLQERVRQLEEENGALKLWGARVEAQLHRYQAVDHHLADVVAQATESEAVPPPPWMDDPTDLPPLIKAYDQRVMELEAAVKEQTDAHEEAVENMEKLRAELAHVNQQLSDTTKQLVAQAQANPGAAAISFGGGDAMLEQRAELEDQLQLALKECSVLSDQVNTLMKDNEQHIRAVNGRDKQLALITQRYQQAVGAVSRLQGTLQRVNADKQTAETKLIQHASSLAESKRGLAKSVTEMKALRDANKKQAGVIDDFKAALTELRAQMDGEKEELDDQIQTASTQASRLQVVVDKQAGELEAMRAEARQSRNEAKHVKREAEKMLAVLQYYEEQIKKFTAKEGTWEREKAASVEAVEAAKLEAQNAQAKETVHRQQVLKCLEQLKVARTQALREKAEAVEAVRAQFEARLGKAHKELRELSLQCAEQQALAERYKRDLDAARHEGDRIMQQAFKAHDAMNRQVEEMVDRMRTVEQERDTADSALREAQAASADAERQWAAKQRVVQEEAAATRRAQEELVAELDDTKAKLRLAEGTAKDLDARLQEVQAKGQKERGRLAARLDAALADKRAVQVEADQRGHEAQLALQQATERITQLQAAEEALREQAREDAEKQSRRFERAVSELTEDRNRLAARNEELSAQLTLVSTQREELAVYRQELDGKLQNMHARVLDAEKRAAAGASQLSQAFGEQERRLQELKTARADADRAKLAEARAVRRQRQIEARLQDVQQQYDQLQAFAGSGPLMLEDGSKTGSPLRRTTRSSVRTTSAVTQS